MPETVVSERPQEQSGIAVETDIEAKTTTPLERSRIFSDLDSYLFHEGTHYAVYRKLGAHPATEGGQQGTRFAVWAPNARSVRVIASATGWEDAPAELGAMSGSESGVWEAFLPGVGAGDAYRFVIEGADGVTRYKSDPYAFSSQLRPENASIVCELDGYEWHDGAYRDDETNVGVVQRPMAIYEVHPGSWRRDGSSGTERPDGYLGYRELAHELADYVEDMGYTHVELIGICEHPFDGSWGYQVTGYYSPTSRHGSPDDFRYLVDYLHQRGIGVILDWVPAHSPKDDFGVWRFDGTPLYEYADPLRQEFPIWGTLAFDHGKPEVKSFFISNALYWLNEFHVDALRVDAVMAMLCNNFERSEWRPNAYGGAENLESFEFFHHINSIVQRQSKGYLIAEDSSGVPDITLGADEGGMGYLFRWNMGWMYDLLRYAGYSQQVKRERHEELVHSLDYAFSENFVLEFSHDEVANGHLSLLRRFPGSELDQFSGLKTLYTFQFTHPGKKLLFMGQDFGVEDPWDSSKALDWSLLEERGHRDVRDTVRALIKLYKENEVLYSDSKDASTFEWVNRNDSSRSVISFIRKNPWSYDGAVLVVCNFSPEPVGDYCVGVPREGWYRRLFSTYDTLGGEGAGVVAPLTAEPGECDGRPYSLSYGLRPYESAIFAFPGA